MPEILGKDVRTLRFTREATNEDGSIDISFSSETDQVQRWFGIEILSHEAGAMDMTRASQGLPFFVNHDEDQHVGRVENIHIGPDRKGRGTVRFSSRPEAQQVRQDMIDGIRPDISVGYLRLEEVTQKGQGGASDIVTVTRWMPFEITSASIPADISVGAGRTATPGEPGEPIQPTAAPQAASTEVRMDPISTPVAAPVAVVPNPQAERAAVLQLRNLGEKFGIREVVENLLNSDRPMGEVRDLVMDELGKREAKPLPAPVVDPTTREAKDYSLLRALRSSIEGGNCAELEISKDIAKRMGKSTDGFFMPTNLPMETRAGLDSSTATKGTELKFTEPGDFISILRNKALVLTMGAQFIPGLQGSVAFPRQTGAGTAAWLATENPGSDTAEGNLLLDQVTLSPKTLITTTSYSKQLLLQSVVGVEQLVRNDLAAIIALAIDLAAINGSGASGQPKGILNVAGIGSYAMGTNGLAIPSIVPLVALETALGAANADIGAMGYLTTPGQRGVMKQTPAFATAGASPIWTEGPKGSDLGWINGYKAGASSQVPNNLTKGTSSGICHAVIFGNFAELLIGEWGALEIIVDPYRLKKQGMIEMTATYFADVAVKHAASFAAIKDAL